jgi:Homeodomain-like domain
MARLFYSHDCEKSSDSDEELQRLLRRVVRNDVLIVPHVSHMGRTWAEVQTNLSFLEDKGVVFAPRHTSMMPAETPEVAFKRDLRRVQSDRARARGCYAGNSGRPRKADAALAMKLHATGIQPEQIAAVLDVSERTVHRYLARQGQAAA